MREILPGLFTWGSTYANKPWDLVNLKEETVNSFVMIIRPIFYSFEAVLTRFTLLEFVKIEKCSATCAL